MERSGRLDRNLLFETTATQLDPVKRITRLLQEYQGVFVSLCQVSGASLCNTYHKNRASVVVRIRVVCVSENLLLTSQYLYHVK